MSLIDLLFGILIRFVEAVWQLVGISQWALGFTETLMKQCILLNATSTSESLNEPKMDVQSDGEDLFGSAPSKHFVGARFFLAKTDPFAASPAFEVGSPILETPTLLHIGHPYALANLHTILTHIKNLRSFVGQLSARGENAQIARDVLVELVDFSGFDIDALCVFLAECIQVANDIPGLPSLWHVTPCQ